MTETTTLDRRGFVKLGAGIGAGLTLGGSLATAAGESSKDAAPGLFEVIAARRSVRKFKPDPVPQEHVLRILDAARMAPTAGNQQPWLFLVLRDRAKLDLLKQRATARRLERVGDSADTPPDQLADRQQAIRDHFEAYLSAPVYIVVLTDSQSEHPEYNDKDGPLAAGYLMLAARALGYGTVFCTDSIPEDITREVFEIPARYRRVCITPLGVPDAWPESPTKKPLEDFVAFEKISG